MSHASSSVFHLLRALGGSAAVARACGVTMQSVGCWQVRDEVPPRHWLKIWRLAKERGLDWRPPGAEGLDLVILPPAADDTAHSRRESSAEAGWR
jgi:hypothetical protein